MTTPDVLLHLTARMNLAILRQPAVTKSLYFMLHSTSDHDRSHVLSAEGKLEPLPATEALTWLNTAATAARRFSASLKPMGY